MKRTNLKNKNISIIIPAYNEERRIKKTILNIIEYLEKSFNEYEIIIVNDCSKDNTEGIVKEIPNKNIILVNNKVNRGKGYSVKQGIMNAKYPYVLFTDSDLATPIEEIDKMYNLIINKYDIVIASRKSIGSKILIKQPWHRRIISDLFPLIVKILTRLNYKDTQCGFKLFKKETTIKCFNKMTIERYAFDIELLYLAKKYKLNVIEVPVTWIDQPLSKIRILRDSTIMLKDILKILINDKILKKY